MAAVAANFYGGLQAFFIYQSRYFIDVWSLSIDKEARKPLVFSFIFSIFVTRKMGIVPVLWLNLQVMKKETKDSLILSIEFWNQFNAQKAVKALFDENEFNKGCWSLDVSFSGIVNSDFIAFILPALSVNNCIWFLSALNDKLILHIQ